MDPPSQETPLTAGVTPFRRHRNRCFLDERLITCDICFEVIYNAANVAPCNHKFCAACILRWASSNNSCPKCRHPITSMTRDSFAQQIIDQYLTNYPERQKPEERRQEADRIELKELEKLLNKGEAGGDDEGRGDNITSTSVSLSSWPTWSEEDAEGSSSSSLEMTFSTDDDEMDDDAPRHAIGSDYARQEYAARVERLLTQRLLAATPSPSSFFPDDGWLPAPPGQLTPARGAIFVPRNFEGAAGHEAMAPTGDGVALDFPRTLELPTTPRQNIGQGRLQPVLELSPLLHLSFQPPQVLFNVVVPSTVVPPPEDEGPRRLARPLRPPPSNSRPPYQVPPRRQRRE